MNEQIKINWYRCKIDKKVMSELMKTSDFRGLCQVIPQITLFFVTAALAYLAYLNVQATNWMWSVPLLLVALFVHGTFGSFMGMGAPVHELSHKTPFKTKALNEFFLKVYSFISWSDWIGYRVSHVKHHQVTVHKGLDGEVVLPQTFDWDSVKFLFTMIIGSPSGIYKNIRGWVRAARGVEIGDWAFKGEWLNKVMPETNVAQRREHRNWARIVLFGQLGLAFIFAVTGHWFLIVVITLGCFYSPWLSFLCGTPQHIGLSPSVPDFRLCCRTYTCSWLPAFLYWNMQYHVEHHMFPAVPFFNLGKLRAAIENDLPPAPHGLWATWKEVLPIVKRQRVDPNYVFVPRISNDTGERASDLTLELEAAGQSA